AAKGFGGFGDVETTRGAQEDVLPQAGAESGLAAALAHRGARRQERLRRNDSIPSHELFELGGTGARGAGGCVSAGRFSKSDDQPRVVLVRAGGCAVTGGGGAAGPGHAEQRAKQGEDGKRTRVDPNGKVAAGAQSGSGSGCRQALGTP
ncbi:MAG TPA: hypothetical protein VI198_05595, partial [Candidatus Eisenbacteria bacterium]